MQRREMIAAPRERRPGVRRHAAQAIATREVEMLKGYTHRRGVGRRFAVSRIFDDRTGPARGHAANFANGERMNGRAPNAKSPFACKAPPPWGPAFPGL